MLSKSTKNIVSQITDLHTHFGHYGDKSFSVDYLLITLKNIGIKRFATMPVPVSEDGYIPDNHKVLEFLKQDDIEVIPILLTSPLMVQEDPEFEKVADIPYRIIKIHPYAHRWHKYPHLTQKILEHAEKESLPVMIHTGYDESQPANFINWFEQYTKIDFILAHGRPANQAFKMIKTYKNVWIEISFMDKDGLSLLISDPNIENRILFGTDLPINELFFDMTSEKYFYERILEIEHLLKDDFNRLLLKWGHSNIQHLFNVPEK